MKDHTLEVSRFGGFTTIEEIISNHLQYQLQNVKIEFFPSAYGKDLVLYEIHGEFKHQQRKFHVSAGLSRTAFFVSQLAKISEQKAKTLLDKKLSLVFNYDVFRGSPLPEDNFVGDFVLVEFMVPRMMTKVFKNKQSALGYEKLSFGTGVFTVILDYSCQRLHGSDHYVIAKVFSPISRVDIRAIEPTLREALRHLLDPKCFTMLPLFKYPEDLLKEQSGVKAYQSVITMAIIKIFNNWKN